MKALILKAADSQPKTVKTTNESVFSPLDLTVQGIAVKATANHNYSIESGYWANVSVKRVFVAKGFDYEKAYQLLISGKNVTPNQVKTIHSGLSSIKFVVVLSNDDEVTARLDLSGTLVKWGTKSKKRDWKEVLADLKQREPKELLTNLVKTLGKDFLDSAEGYGVMYQSYRSQ